MNSDYKILLDKPIVNQDDNPLIILALKHFRKMHIWSCLINILLLIPMVFLLYFVYIEFNLSQNTSLLHVYVSSTFFIWLFFSVLSQLPFNIFAKKSFLLEHPLIRNQLIIYHLLSFFFFGIPFIFFFNRTIRTLSKSTMSYCYENNSHDVFSEERPFANWILLVFILCIGIGFGVSVYLLFLAFTEVDIRTLLISLLLISFGLPFFYAIFLILLSLWGEDTQANWKWNQAIYVIGVLGLFLTPLVIIILILKIHDSRSKKSNVEYKE